MASRRTRSACAVRPDGVRRQRPGLGDAAVPTAYLEDLAAQQASDELLAIPPGSVGLRMPYQHFRTVNPADGQPLPAGEPGLIDY
jgi:hypothetical protein